MSSEQIWMGDGAKLQPVPEANFCKAEPVDRLLAYLIDVLVFSVGMIFLCIPGIVYFLLRDALFDGRSFGKKMMGLRVLNAETSTPCKTNESIVRNVSLMIPLFGIYDGLLVFIDPAGRRFGDQWAKTMVVKDR